VRATALHSILMLVLLALLTGVIYPWAVTGIARVVYPAQAEGSLIIRQGQPIGSELLGLSFTDPRYFLGRPSATIPQCNAAASSGSNLGPRNPALADSIRSRVARLRALDPENNALVPVDLVTASGSGLDPHLSPAAALYQVHRIARVRGLSEEAVRSLVREQVEGRQLGILGEPRVNVLRLNLALDDLTPAR
jgi:potassium-transporting ATPase KdpC subunit